MTDLERIRQEHERRIAHLGDEPEVAEEHRMARCDCGVITISSPSLGFFASRGEGSKWATEQCANCPYLKIGHEKGLPRARQLCDNFTPTGPAEFDHFYCGHSGWD